MIKGDIVVKSKRKLVSLSFMFVLLVGTLNVSFFSNFGIVEATDSYPSSIILFIGDGMGLEHVKFGSLVEYGNDTFSSILNFPFNTTISTNNIDGGTTDSAASGTAISTGVKTKNGRIAMNYNAEMDLTTILEIAQMNGYATGLVATCHLTHATPAAFAAHSASRNDYQNIASDFNSSNVDVLLAGGSSTKYVGNYIDGFTTQGYTYITTETEMDGLSSTPVLGLFDSGSLPRMQTMDENSTVPTLLEMTIKAIDLLNATSKPFFLMVEGSQIDWAGHDNDEVYLAHEVIEFEKAVRYAKNLAMQETDLQVLVTADHETGGFNVESYTVETEIPYETDSYDVKQEKRTNRSQEIAVSWSSGGHTKTKVILAGIGPFSGAILNAEHHIDTFSIMRQAVDGETEPIGEGFYDHYLPTYAWILIFLSPTIISITLAFVFSKILRKKKS